MSVHLTEWYISATWPNRDLFESNLVIYSHLYV